MRGWLFVAMCAGCGFTPGATSSSNGMDGAHPGSDARTPDGDKIFMDAPAVTGMLTVDVTPEGATDINLTTEGTLDWAHWGYLATNGFDHKSGGDSISNLVNPPAFAFTGAPLTASWTNGTPHGVVTQTTSGVGCRQGASLAFTVPADTSTHTLYVYAGVQQASARLDVSLSDNSAPAQMKTLTDTNNTTNVRYAITFNAASANQHLTVSWTDTNDSGGQALAAMLSATLQ